MLVLGGVIVAMLVAVACGSSGKTTVGSGGDAYGNGDTAAPTTTPATGNVGATGDFVADKNKTYDATIETNMGTIKIRLDSAHAPVASGRFIELARAGFYNGLTFHRAVPNFVIQGGDPKGDGSGGSGRPPVVGETPADNYPIGSLAAAKTGADPPGTFDCQFFIVTGDQGVSLPTEYARFGSVTSGMDVAKKIEGLAPAGDGPPTKKVTMTKVTITES
jgi:cyclophilin family peptidyl-prolyl cis-trans isomerase